jgi:hypothetical protein
MKPEASMTRPGPRGECELDLPAWSVVDFHGVVKSAMTYQEARTLVEGMDDSRSATVVTDAVAEKYRLRKTPAETARAALAEEGKI